MDITLFDYHLPPELVAQHPAKKRGSSKLMVFDRQSGQTEIHPFGSVINYLHKGDALVIN
ncbi:MAG: S-adenosylmethionine:tRNA ribosyltransferase-isomerase, partial [Candidatus Zixiibacteriota bacterium]